MLNLADYESSCSDGDEDSADFAENSESASTSSKSSNLLSALPKPIPAQTASLSVIPEDALEDEVIKKHTWEIEAANRLWLMKSKPAKGKVKILLPEAPAADEDSDDSDFAAERSKKLSVVGNKMQTASSSSGISQLLSLLPAPKSAPSSSSDTKLLKIALNNESSEQKNTTAKLLIPSSALKSNRSGRDSPAKISTLNILGDNKKSSLPLVAYDSDEDWSDDEDTAQDQDNACFTRGGAKTGKAADFFSLDHDKDTQLEEQQTYFHNEDNKYEGIVEPVKTDGASKGSTIPAYFQCSEVDDEWTNNSAMHPSRAYNLASCSADFADDEDIDEKARRLIYEHESKLNAGGGNGTESSSFRLPQDLDIVDVSVDNQLGNVRENLLRNLTDASRTNDAMLEAARLASQAGGGKSKKDKPSQVAKRKHQITYLAHLAREREETLKNQWAQNRQTKREAQMRYGF